MSYSAECDQQKAWLQRLKDESWEAELLVSAVAIFGAFQLFTIVEWMANQFLDFLHPEQYQLGFYIGVSAMIAVSVLVCMFIIHFALRSYWVGMIGLNSVFPDFNIKNSMHSEYYTEKMQAKIPSLRNSIDNIDDLCSVIFSAAFSLLLVYVFISLSLTLYLIVYNVLSPYVADWVLLAPLVVLGATMLLHSVLSVLANLQSMHGNIWVQRLYYRTTLFTNIATYGPLFKNIVQVALTFSSNYRTKKGLPGLMMMFFLCGMTYSMYNIINSNLFYLQLDDHFQLNDRYHFEFYQNQNSEMKLLIAPELISDVVSDSVMQLFIPVLSNESRRIKTGKCGSLAQQGETRKQRRRQENQQTVDCYRHYHTILLNGVEQNAQLLRSNHRRTKQRGVTTYISLEQANIGANTLTIVKAFDDEQVSWSIPFQYAPSSR